jgi:DNA-binding ferritin-like protein (Dps family)
MSVPGKNKLLLTIGMAVLVTASALLLIVAAPEARLALFAIAGIVVLIALAGVAFALAKYKHVERRVEKLPADYRSAYLDIHELLGTYEMTGADRRNILTMVLEIFEHARLDNRSAQDVVGGDLAAFTDRFVSETGRAHTLGYRLSYATALFIAFLLFLKAYKVLRTGVLTLSALRSETLDVGIVITYLIISYAFFPWLIATVRRSAREQWRGAKRMLILLPMMIPVGLMAALIGIENPAWRAVIDRPFPIFTSPLAVVLGVVLLVGAILLTRFFRRK